MTTIRPASKRWGIVVGVDEYSSAGEHLRNLTGCVADARRMFYLMIDKECCGFAEDHIIKLENPTYTEIESAFEDIGGRMAKGDELWFYYAGHGYSERRRNGVSGYLLPSDVKLSANGKLSTQGCISHSGLRDDFIARYIGCGNITVVLFLDCCCAASIGLTDGSRSACADAKGVSDGFTSSFRDLGATRTGDDDNWDFKYISFMATDKSGKAKEDASGGVFTKYLIEGLKGGRSDCPTVGPAPTDIYVRAGSLGVFLGHHVPNQPPLQDFLDVTYALSVSKDRKARQEKMRQMDKQTIAWLSKMMENSLLEADIQQFAFAIISDAESNDFLYAGLLRNLMRLFSADQALSQKLEEGATLIKAFCTLKKLLERKDSFERITNESPEPKQRVSPVRPLPSTPLTLRDKELLADIEGRLCEVDGEEIDLADVGRKTQTDAADALDAVARKRMRQMCGKMRYAPIFSKNERDSWSMRARRGFSSVFEAAVYELVKDDKALAMRKS